MFYLYGLLETCLFRSCLKEAAVFTFLKLWLILFHIFGLRKGKTCSSTFAFYKGITNAICDLVLYPLSEGWDMSLISNCTILFQFLKTVAGMHDCTLSETGSQFSFLSWVKPM